MEFDEEHVHMLIDLSKLKGHNYVGVNFCSQCNKETKWNPVYLRQCSECSLCGKQYYPMAGTIFEKTNTPLSKWKKVFDLLSIDAKIIDIKKEIDVTYKTAWSMYWRIEAAIRVQTVEYILLTQPGK